jgi:hypothetical protein
VEGILLFDVSGLLRLSDITKQADFNELLEALTQHIEKGKAGFPRRVVEELKVLARDEPITQWCIGLGNGIRHCNPTYSYFQAIMDVVAELGFDEGLENPDGSEPSFIYTVARSYFWRLDGQEVVIVSEDVGDHPLRPTMEQLCDRLSCPMIDARSAVRELSLSRFLR